MQRFSIVAAATAMPVTAVAHPGHDYAHGPAGAAFVFLLVGFLSMLAVMACPVARRRRAIPSQHAAD